ncbi:hypothetical protein ACIRO3_21675 [Streptomyces sp. NPDC102278]|uniref:hypothetical protein n=1 Tax=Streptomyces sp. NPDC102278 TaxID=3366152 RepID=UPI00380AEA51
MSAPTHAPSLDVPSGRRRTAAGSGADARLHWWALALPALAFGLLVLLLAGAGSGAAHAAPAENSSLVQVTEQLLRAVG